MKNHKLVIHGTSINTPYLQRGGESASSNLYIDGVENAELHFSVEQLPPASEEGNVGYLVTPTNVTYDIKEMNSGTKISIEVVDNGYIIKSPGVSKIVSDDYEMRKQLVEISVTENKYDVPFDDEMEFENIQSTIDAIIVKVQELETA